MCVMNDDSLEHHDIVYHKHRYAIKKIIHNYKDLPLLVSKVQEEIILDDDHNLKKE